ncbi:MAG: Ig-like domain-containing protein, partial [Clostridiales bacterium]|nr:Ig-like domain-containing protein [Clostridiales bacterium]
MPDIHAFEPLFEEWRIIKELGSGSYSKVYLACKDGNYYSAIKHITIPYEPNQSQELYALGLVSDAETLNAYYENLKNTLESEIKLNDKLKGITNIVSYDNHKIIKKANEPGYDIFIKMEYLTGLIEHKNSKGLYLEDIVHLGIDICKALTILQQESIVHRDIKPTNILVNRNGDFKLGDFGVARTIEKTANTLTVKGTYAFMAPEVVRGAEGDYRVDIFSLGLVLYKLLNKDRYPFLPLPPERVNHEQVNSAQKQLWDGVPLPPPADADEDLAKIILKACAYQDSDRYSDAEQFRQDLLAYQSKIPTRVAKKLIFEKIESEPPPQDLINPLAQPKPDLMQQPVWPEPSTPTPPKPPPQLTPTPFIFDKTITPKSKASADFKRTLGIIIGLSALFLVVSIAILLPLISNSKSAGPPLEAIILSSDSLDLQEGQQSRLSLKVEPDGAKTRTPKWSSNKKDVASIDKTGNVTAIGAGSAKITVKCGNFSAYCLVTVREPEPLIIEAAEIIISSSAMIMEEGEQFRLTAAVMPDDTTDKSLKWSSNSNYVAAVDSSGNVTALKAGSANIIVECGNVSATCVVTVNDPEPPPVLPVTFKDPIIAEIISDQLNIEVEKITADDLLLVTNLNFRGLLNDSIIESYADFLSLPNLIRLDLSRQPQVDLDVIAQKTLITELYISNCGLSDLSLLQSLTDLEKLDISHNKVESIEFLRNAAKLLTLNIDDNNIKDLSPLTNCASLLVLEARDNPVGDWDAVKSVGTVYPTIGTPPPEPPPVTPATVSATSVSLSAGSLSLEAGQSRRLTATVKPDNTTNKTLSWSSNNTGVASVNNGNVTARGAGTARITVRCGNVSATCTVTVRDTTTVQPASITISSSSKTMKEGDKDKLSATVKPDNTTNKTLSWSSNNRSAVTVDSSGNITAVAAGAARITVSCGGVSASCVVTVEEKVTVIQASSV